MSNLKQHIESLLRNTKFSDEKGVLFVNKILEAIEKIDTDLVEILIKDKKAKKQFFSKVLDTFVMNQFKLIDFFSMNNYFEESYTSYTNKIGLIRKDDFIKKNNDVVLAFPYKDCVLEGGQTKDDQKGKENFFNEVLDSDEIDRLFEPKVLTNIKRYSKDGIEENPTISDKDNLILKGNNLLALHSLKKKYAGKVKLIYIDPPYNTRTEANTFAYNNTFNHSTWLTFMKNRLDVAKELLCENGLIFIDIDHYELFYLGVLADEIFGYENRIGNLSVVHNLKGRYNEFFSISHENKIVYAKDASKVVIKNFSHDNSKDYPHTDNIGKYKLVGLQRTGDGSKREDRPNLFYPIYFDDDKKDIHLDYKEGLLKILPIDNKGIERRWRWSKDKVLNEWKTEVIVKKSDNGYKIYTKLRIKGEKPKSVWINPKYSGTTATNDLKEIFGDKVFSYPKSKNLVKDSIQISTDKKDIILDFFGGSGTTGHAILELNKEDGGNRKFIMVEQMDYIETITVPRIVKVMERDNIDDSFVYAELKQVSNFDNADKKLKQEMRYLPIGELEDEDYKISKKEIAINKAFYGVDDE